MLLDLVCLFLYNKVDFKRKGKQMDHYFTNNQNLKSEIRTLSYNYNNITIDFFSDNGVFSKNHLDYGSRLLI